MGQVGDIAIIRSFSGELPAEGNAICATSHLDQGPQGFSIYCPHLSRKFALMRDAMLVHFGVADFA